jgi:vesicle coat complex subunit
MASPEASCYTVVFEDNAGETPSTQELREALQKGSDDVKFDTLRRIIVSTINGNPQVQQFLRVDVIVKLRIDLLSAPVAYAGYPIRDALQE